MYPWNKVGVESLIGLPLFPAARDRYLKTTRINYFWGRYGGKMWQEKDHRVGLRHIWG
jgi:hypothetical protein